jgi:hypothetical protein
MVVAEKRPALTHPARAGDSILRSGREKACGAVEQEKKESFRKKEKKKEGVRGLTSPVLI